MINKQEMVDLWTDYLHAIGNIEGTTKYLDMVGDTPRSRFTEEIVYQYPFLSEVRHSQDGSAYGRVIGSKYEFRIERDGPEAPWTLERLVLNQARAERP